MTVVMPPRRAPTQAFHNKPYFPDIITVRRSSRLLASDVVVPPVSINPRRSPSTGSQSPPAKRRRLPNDAPPRGSPKTLARPKLRLDTALPSMVASSKRKAPLIEEDIVHPEAASSVRSRRKRRKENAVVDKIPASAPCPVQMRPMPRNKPRARSSTNKYGTRSAASGTTDPADMESAPVIINPPPISPKGEPCASSNPDTSPQILLSSSSASSPPPPQTAVVVIDEFPKDESIPPDTADLPPVPTADPPMLECAHPPPAPPTPPPPQLQQQDTHLYASPPRPSYVTYTDLTPFTPDSNTHTTHTHSHSHSHTHFGPTPTFPPSILSELHDDFSFPSDPDLDPSALLNPAEGGFSQGLQDQMGAGVGACGGGGASCGAAGGSGGGGDQQQQWSREARQREVEEARRQKTASQRRDRLWTNLTDQKYKEFVKNHGIDEVRARVKADTQKAAAREAAAVAARSNHAAQALGSGATAKTTTTRGPEPPPAGAAIRPSFEMYSPDDADADSKSDVEDEDEDDDDSEGSVDADDIPPDTNFDLPPPLIVSPLKANPLSVSGRGGVPTVFGTPPFLERRQAWGGGEKLVYLSLKHSAELQQPRPPPRANFLGLGAGVGKLPPPSSFPVPSSSMLGRAPPAPVPVPVPVSVSYPSHHHQNPQQQQQQQQHPHPTPDFGSDPTESYADPTIMQAIIASMSPGMDFAFGGNISGGGGVDGGAGAGAGPANWADGMGLLPEVGSVAVDMEPWATGVGVGVGFESSSSAFPRSSQVLSASSSTLHSALG